MRSSKGTYEDVARNCKEYKPTRSMEGTLNSNCECSISCTNCSHFSHDGAYCEIDMYDKVLEQIK